MLRFRGVACARGGRLLWRGLDLTLEPGGAVLVTGANGAGKSSLIRVAAGLLAPAAGRVERAAPPALLTEAHALDAEAPLARALAFWAGRAAAARAMERLGLAALAAVPVRLLSTGQRRRAGLARVAASGAALWLLDEPASGLDAGSVAGLEALLADHRAAGGAVLIASHQPLALPDAAEVALPGASGTEP